MNILFLTAWYPHRYDKMAGLFVQKHAEAVSLFQNVYLVYIHADTTIRTSEIEVSKQGKVTEIRVYYPVNRTTKTAFFSKFIGFISAYMKAYQWIKDNKLKINIVHVNVLTRTGVVAFIYKLFTATPYVVTEHWTRYLPERNAYTGFFRKMMTKLIVRNAEAVMPVSNLLHRAMLNCNLPHPNYQIIDNVIDPVFEAEYALEVRSKKRIVLVSCFLEPAKNVKGIIRTISKLAAQRNDFELQVVGDGPDFREIYQYSNGLNLTDTCVFFVGEKDSAQVAEAIFNSDFMVLFSNFETAGIVITESLALGKPVLTTEVGIAPDFINSDTGIIIKVGDETALLEKLNYMLDNIEKFDQSHIRNQFKSRFTYLSIGQKINSVYLSIRK